jgi:hypothetical protein
MFPWEQSGLRGRILISPLVQNQCIIADNTLISLKQLGHGHAAGLPVGYTNARLEVFCGPVPQVG